MASKNFDYIRINGHRFAQLKDACKMMGIKENSLHMRIHRESKKGNKDFTIFSNKKAFDVKLVKE